MRISTEDEYWGEIPFPTNEIDGKSIRFRAVLKWDGEKVPLDSAGRGTIIVNRRVRLKKVESRISIVCRHKADVQKTAHLKTETALKIKKSKQGSKSAFFLTSKNKKIV